MPLLIDFEVAPDSARLVAWTGEVVACLLLAVSGAALDFGVHSPMPMDLR